MKATDEKTAATILNCYNDILRTQAELTALMTWLLQSDFGEFASSTDPEAIEQLAHEACVAIGSFRVLISRLIPDHQTNHPNASALKPIKLH
tara:strand:+ start:1775 stop:2050 length:276 start_codon:yes stop_codon:yes gene_type:complete